VREIAGMNRSANALAALCGIVALAILPRVAPAYYVGLMIPFYGYAVALLGFNLLFGYAGLLSFGHAMFLCIGAYGAAIMSYARGEVVRTDARRGDGRVRADRAADRGAVRALHRNFFRHADACLWHAVPLVSV